MRELSILASFGILMGCAGSLGASTRTHLRNDARCARSVPMPAERLDDGSFEGDAAMDPELARVARAGRMGRVLSEEGREIAALARLSLLRSELAATMAEVDCLGDQLEDLQDELVERARTSERRFTIASIVIGAISGLGAGIIELADDNHRAAPVVAIVGGVASAVLGVVAAVRPAPRVSITHQRNLLRALWREEEHALPTSVGQLLVTPRVGAERSAREQIRGRWRELIEAQAPAERERAALEALLFGDGGDYDVEQLRLREAMLEELETEVDLMNLDLELLARELLRRAEAR
ncbi:MAG: hypothetical protein KF901_14130 [Myxococcales bacterium]|nr:hypothetical protein [Myxococcales bacterium]